MANENPSSSTPMPSPLLSSTATTGEVVQTLPPKSVRLVPQPLTSTQTHPIRTFMLPSTRPPRSIIYTRVRKAIIYAIVGFILMGIPFIIYKAMVKKHRDPTFTLDYASVTSFNLTSDGHLTSFFNVMIRANNQNQKLKLKYQYVRVSIFKDKQNLAEDAVPGFTQRKLNVKLKKRPVSDFELESGSGYLNFDIFMTALLDGNNLEVNCRQAVVNLTAPAVAAANSPSFNINNGQHFKSVGCSVHIYSTQ